MSKVSSGMLSIVLMMLSLSCSPLPSQGASPSRAPREEIKLPEPRYDSDFSIEETLLNRRSIREYSREALTLEEVSQLLWSAQGVTSPSGQRTAPSAGGTYPLEVYLIAGNVRGLAAGVYLYEPEEHKLLKFLGNDLRASLADAALSQDSVKEAAIDIVLTAVYERTTQRYSDRGIRYVHLEAGHAAQNIQLQGVALGLGSVVIGAFFDDRVQELLKLPADEQPLYIIPVGKR